MVFGDDQCHSNSPRTFPGCHGNEIWDKMGYNSASVSDICEIFVSVGYIIITSNGDVLNC